MLPTLLNLHHVYILPVVISIFHGHIQGEIWALQKSVQVYHSRTRLLTFVRTLFRSWLQSYAVTIPTAYSELHGYIKTPIKQDWNVSKLQNIIGRVLSFSPVISVPPRNKRWAPLGQAHTYPYSYWAKMQDEAGALLKGWGFAPVAATSVFSPGLC